MTIDISSDFESIAKEIVRKSICSAICIDDSFKEPYSTDLEGDAETPRELVKSFKSNKCSLDVFRYEHSEKWNSFKDYVLCNRDLLIIDWKLGGDPPFGKTLEILMEAIKLPSLSYIIIYTDDTDVDLLPLQLHSYFGKAYAADVNEMHNKFDKFLSNIEEHFIEYKGDNIPDNVNDYFRYISNECKDYILSTGIRSDSSYKLFHDILIRSFNDLADHNVFLRKLMDTSSAIYSTTDLRELLKIIIYNYYNCMYNTLDVIYTVEPLIGIEHSYIINNTLIFVFKKPQAGDGEHVAITPEHVYDKFSELVCNKQNSIITLLTMEMTALYKEKSCIIGKELSDIDEVVFFLYKQNLNSEDGIFNENDFYNFIMECWREQLSSFDNSQIIKLFQVLDSYEQSPKVEGRKQSFMNGSNIKRLQKEIIKLNNYYSFIKSKRSDADKIKFGDIFNITNDPSNFRENFLLCITPHCDCLRPGIKIKNKFFFVHGSKVPPEEGLKNAEKGCYSFIIHNDTPMCIKWTPKPFTLYISEENNRIGNIITSKHYDEDCYLKYIATQKENYTQRIANRSFSNASRIGISLVQLDTEEYLKQPKDTNKLIGVKPN